MTTETVLSHPRRYAKACDACYRKKIKCEPEGDTCQLCRRAGSGCVFTRVEKGQRRRPRRTNDLSALEERLKNMESLIRRSQTGEDHDSNQRHPQSAEDTSRSNDTSPTVSLGTEYDDCSPVSRISNHQAVFLVQGYLESCNSAFPIWNCRSLLQRLRQDWPPDKDSDLVWWTTVMIALSCAYRIRAMNYPSGAEADNKEASRYLSEVMEVAPKLAVGKPSLGAAQVLLAITSVMMGSATPESARTFMSCAVQILYEIGAHEADTLDKLIDDAPAERSRVWWVAYNHDKNIAMASGKPPVIHDQYITRPPPQWSDVEGFGLVRSADGLSEANLLVISYRLAVLQSEVHSRVLSPAADLTPEGLQASQAVLNPLLDAWRNGVPFIFKPESLVGVWPEKTTIFLVLLHFQYFRTLIMLNREPTVRPLASVAPGAPAIIRDHAGDCPYSVTPFVVDAARDALNLASLLPKGNLQHVWLFLDYGICAAVALMVNGIIRPLETYLVQDFRQVDEWLRVFDLLASSSERSNVVFKEQVLKEMRQWAISRVKSATAEKEANEAAAQVWASLDGVSMCHDLQLWATDESFLRPDNFPLDQWDSTQHNFLYW